MERSGPQKLVLSRKLAGTTWGADSSVLTKAYTPTVRPTMEYASTTWGTAAKTNKSRLDKVQNMALLVILGVMKTNQVDDMGKMYSQLRGVKVSKFSSKEKNSEGCFPALYAQTWHSPPKLASTPEPEPPVQRTIQDTPRHCGCASRAADRSCLEAR